ncbi:MAG: hypothetical protein ACTS5I_13835, partial [Rhodanobacter sp.]
MATATTATNAMALASRGAAAALGLIGGPAGLAVLAGSALVYFAATSESVEQTVARLTRELDQQTTAFTELNAVQARSAQLDVQARFDEASQASQTLRDRVEALK